jgi:hypothetical protein
MNDSLLRYIKELTAQLTAKVLIDSDTAIILDINLPDGDFMCAFASQCTLAKYYEMLSKSDRDLVKDGLVWTNGLLDTNGQEVSLNELLESPYHVWRIASEYRECVIVRMIEIKGLGLIRQILSKLEK